MEFRFAQRKDTGIILDFINRLAEYEHMSDDVVATEALLEEWIFDRKKAQVLFALQEGKEVGIALYFYNFSTFLFLPKYALIYDTNETAIKNAQRISSRVTAHACIPGKITSRIMQRNNTTVLTLPDISAPGSICPFLRYQQPITS